MIINAIHWGRRCDLIQMSPNVRLTFSYSERNKIAAACSSKQSTQGTQQNVQNTTHKCIHTCGYAYPHTVCTLYNTHMLSVSTVSKDTQRLIHHPPLAHSSGGEMCATCLRSSARSTTDFPSVSWRQKKQNTAIPRFTLQR